MKLKMTKSSVGGRDAIVNGWQVVGDSTMWRNRRDWESGMRWNGRKAGCLVGNAQRRKWRLRSSDSLPGMELILK